MSSSINAVFLSYASQDAEAAKRICDALRSAGVEVWFDQSELVGGDAWDAKIRKQIAECALFVPVISANTQARLEGYFRIEWKLAAQRTHAMAEAKPFLLPVIIDQTRDTDAHVPAEFRAVQWTRLPIGQGQGLEGPGGAACARFADRVRQLLPSAGEAAPAQVATNPAANRGQDGGESARRQPDRPFRWVRHAAAIGGVLVALVYVLRSPERKAGPNAAAPNAAGQVAPAAVRGWPHDPELKRAIALIDGLEATLEDFRLADEIATRGLERAPSDPEAVTVRARVHSAFVMRNFDFSSERTALAKRYGERAVQLAPDEPEALYALSIFLHDRAGDEVRGEALARRACELSPGEPRFWRQAMRTVVAQRPDEGLAMGEELVRRFPRDTLTHYELSIAYRNRRDWEKFERETDAVLALAPLANAINWKARASLLRDDWAGMRQCLDRVPARARAEERTVVSSIIYALLSGDYEFGLKSLQGFAEPWFFDVNNYSGPAALPQAMLLAQQGKAGLARTQYDVAFVELARHRAANPTDLSGKTAEIWILLGLGRLEEARALHRTAIESLRRPFRVFAMSAWWFDAIPRSLLLGERATAIQLVREAAAEPEGRNTIRRRMQADARMTPFRDDPEIAALLAERNESAAGSAAPSEGAQLAARALALFTKVGFTRDDLAPAEEFARRATEREPDSAAAWGVRAGVQAAWLFRGWDVSQKRREDTQTLANRALSLDPNEPEALLALSHVLRTQAAFDQAEAILRRAILAHADHIRLARALGYTLYQHGREPEARAILLETVKRAPRDALLRYELALTYGNYGTEGARQGDQSAAIEQLDAAIATQVFSSALVLKATLLGGWGGDLPAMRAVLDRMESLPLEDRAEDRAVCVAMWAGLIEHRPDRVEAAAALTARNYLDDLAMPLRPKAWSLALAHRIAGKDNVARADWQAAEAVLRQRLKDDPANVIYQAELAITLAWLGQRDEAGRLIGPLEPIWKEAPTPMSQRLLALFYAAQGDAKHAAPYLAATIDRTPFSSHRVMELDPCWDKLRGQPEFETLRQATSPTK